MIDGLRTRLWQHQSEAVAFARARRGSMLAMDMGTGKTLTSIAVAHAVKARRVLIACPLSVVGTWPREFATHSALPWRVVACDRGSVAKKAADARVALDLAIARSEAIAIVVNHESLWRPPFSTLLAEVDWDLFILDESHRAKAPGGKLSRFLSEFTKRAPLMRRLALTGTPMPHSPLDLYAQYRLLDRSIYGTSAQRFRMRYAEMGGFEGREIVAWRNTEELMAKFRRIAFEARKQDVLDLPEEVDVEIEVELEPAAMKVYRQIDRAFWAEVEKGTVTASNALVKLLRLQQLSSGLLRLDDGAGDEVISTAKAGALRDILEDTREPVVVFGRFVHDLDVVAAATEAAGRTYGEVSGRRKDLDASRMPLWCDVLGVQIQAGGVGVDLTRASTAVFLSTGFSLGEYVQARARLHRPGQTRRVTFVHVVAKGTIDARVAKALAARAEVVESLLAQGRIAA